MTLVRGLGLTVVCSLVALGACGGSSRPVAAPTENPVVSAAPAGIDAPLASDPEPVAAPESGSSAATFLVLHAPELTLIDRSGRRSVLATDVQEASYDAVSELVWLRTSSELRVYDLRQKDVWKPAESVLIASGVENGPSIWVSQEGAGVMPDDGCESPSIQLDWTREPSIEGMLEPQESAKLEGQAWLARELNRPRRKVPGGRHSEFDLRAAKTHSKLPKKLTSCDEPTDCGTSVPFASWGIELVLVYDQQGGDCWERKCVLHDPKTGQFARPPLAEHWGSLAETKAGSCGPFQFDATGDAFIYGQSLCTKDGCTDLGGDAVGWLEPGPTVGTPGSSEE